MSCVVIYGQLLEVRCARKAWLIRAEDLLRVRAMCSCADWLIDRRLALAIIRARLCAEQMDGGLRFEVVEVQGEGWKMEGNGGGDWDAGTFRYRRCSVVNFWDLRQIQHFGAISYSSIHLVLLFLRLLLFLNVINLSLIHI